MSTLDVAGNSNNECPSYYTKEQRELHHNAIAAGKKPPFFPFVRRDPPVIRQDDAHPGGFINRYDEP
jgi:hypothetical protein